MCILFSYFSRSIKPNEFKFILLSNRDEYHHRLSKPASFINQNNLYGIDLTPGKEGGTWLGLNRSGRISALLNLDRNEHGFEENKNGRGFLVPNYLNSTGDCTKYADEIKPQVDSFNPFTQIFYEKNEKNLWECSWIDSLTGQLSKSNSEFFSISNHIFTNPYPKTITGEKMFKDVVSTYNNIDHKQELINKLKEMAKFDAGKKFEPYMATDDEARIKMMRDQVFIDIPVYGTRTHTIILIDDKNKCTFHEHTMKCPIDSKKPEWIENTYEFIIGE